MQSESACVYFCSLGCCGWCWLQHLLFIVQQLHTWIGTWVGYEVSTPKISTVAKCLLPTCLLGQSECLLCQHVHPQNVYCLGWIQRAHLGKKYHLYIRNLADILVFCLKPCSQSWLCIMSLFSGKCMVLSIFYQLFAFLLPKCRWLHHW